jgi:hypothetical protein
MDGEVLVIPQPLAKLPIRRKPSTCHHCGEPWHFRPKCPHQQVQRKKMWQAPKTPMCHQCGVSSHIRPRCPPPKPPRHHRSPPRKSCSKALAAVEAFSSKKDLGPQEAVYGGTKNCRKGDRL